MARASKLRSKDPASDPTWQSVHDAREKYASAWSAMDAHLLEKDGQYARLTADLGPPRNVLEVGVGDGRSTLSLLRAGHEVVGVDESPACLLRAAARLQEQGHKASVHLRGAVRPATGGYIVHYKSVPDLAPGIGPQLVEGDILHDPALFAWLRSHRTFNAITCWFMSRHTVQFRNIRSSPESADKYLHCIHRVLYELGGHALPEEGRLHIVDWLLVPKDPDLRGQVLGAHRALHETLSEGTGLKIDPALLTISHTPLVIPDGLPRPPLRGSAQAVERELLLVRVLARRTT